MSHRKTVGARLCRAILALWSAASLRDGLVIATYRFNDNPSLAALQGRSSPGTAGLQGFFQVAGARKSNRETTRKTG